MEIDLNLHPARSSAFHAQVCILGAGIAGITLAHRLSQQGIEVALLEAGGRALDNLDHALFAQAQLSGEPHLGTTKGRFHVFGGSSLGWGGQLLPLPSELSAVWPISAAELAPYAAAAERLLGVDDLPYTPTAFFECRHTPLPALLGYLPEIAANLSKWTPFVRRNLANTLGKELRDRSNVNLYLHAQATELLLADTRTRIEAVLVRTPAGGAFRFEADQYVLAAGTVEAVRLLLASRSVAPAGIGNEHDQVGQNFHDHLTVPAAMVAGRARATMLREFRPWIFDATLHSAKLAASPDLCKRLDLNPVLAHLTIEEPADSGLAILREILAARQRGDLGSNLAAHAAHIPSAAIEALRLAWSAGLYHRRFVSPHANVMLRLNAAQDAPSPSRIRLGDRLDAFGVPEPQVDWRVTPHELATFQAFAGHLRERFEELQRNGFELDGLHWLPMPDAPLPPIEDARHAMGGACMGVDPRSSVVAPDLSVHGVANLYVASAATFPTGEPPLPSLPLMALSLRLAEQIAQRIAAQPQ